MFSINLILDAFAIEDTIEVTATGYKFRSNTNFFRSFTFDARIENWQLERSFNMDDVREYIKENYMNDYRPEVIF